MLITTDPKSSSKSVRSRLDEDYNAKRLAHWLWPQTRREYGHLAPDGLKQVMEAGQWMNTLMETPRDCKKKEVLATLREKYLFAFRNAMLFGKCAGTVTELPLLHRATLTLEARESA